MQKIRVVLGLALLFCFSLSLNGNCQMVDVDTSKAANFNGRYRLSASDGRLYIRAKTGVKVGVANLTDISTVQVDNLSDDYIPYWDGLVWRNSSIVDSSGKIGINQTNPIVELDIVGGGKFSGDLDVRGKLLVYDSLQVRRAISVVDTASTSLHLEISNGRIDQYNGDLKLVSRQPLGGGFSFIGQPFNSSGFYTLFNIDAGSRHSRFYGGLSVRNIGGGYEDGDLTVQGLADIDGNLELGAIADVEAEIDAKQATLVSATNIKTIEGNTLLGSGNIDLAKADVGLSAVDNLSNADLAVSTAGQTALNLKANLASPTFTGTVSGVTSTMVGLGNVTNLSNANLAVSTAGQAALNLKANLSGADFTGDISINGHKIGIGNGSSLTNIALGRSALPINTGTYNLAIGEYSLLANTTGSFNVAVGRSAVVASITGSANIGMGAFSMQALNSGGDNLSIGVNSGRWYTGSANLTTSNQGIFIGNSSKAKANTSINETVIGYAAIGNGNNTVTIGNSSVTGNYFTGDILGDKLLIGTETDSGEDLIVNGTAKISGDVEFGANVGVGTASPTYKLDVAGDARVFSSTTHSRLRVDAAAGYNPNLYLTENGATKWIVYNNNTEDVLNFANASASTKMVIDQTGNVGIGTSSPTLANLQVNGSIGSLPAYTAAAQLKLGDSGTPYWIIQRKASSADLTFSSVTSGDVMTMLNSSGKVGINTTSPTEALDIDSDAIRIRTASTPASATAAGAVGEIRWDASYMYICTATNTWKRSAIATW